MGREERAAEDSGPNFDRCVAISRSGASLAGHCAAARDGARSCDLDMGSGGPRARTGGFRTVESERANPGESPERERARGIRRMQMHCRHSSSFHGLFTKRRVPRAVQEPVLLAPNRTAEGASSAAYCRAAISGLRGAGRSGAFCGVQFSETYCGCADLPHGILHGVVCRAQTKPCRIPRGKSAR